VCTLFNSECTISAGNTLRIGPAAEHVYFPRLNGATHAVSKAARARVCVCVGDAPAPAQLAVIDNAPAASCQTTLPDSRLHSSVSARTSACLCGSGRAPRVFQKDFCAYFGQSQVRYRVREASAWSTFCRYSLKSADIFVSENVQRGRG